LTLVENEGEIATAIPVPISMHDTSMSLADLSVLKDILAGLGISGAAAGLKALLAGTASLVPVAAAGGLCYYVLAMPEGRELADSLVWGPEHFSNQKTYNEYLQGKMSEAKKKAEGTSGHKEKGKTEEKLPNQETVDGGVKDAPSVDAGKQGKHVPGHNNNNPEKSQWKDGTTGVKETQEGWQKGKELPDGTKVWDTGKPIGKNGETGVRIHIDGKGNIHGYPVNPGQYLKK